MNLIMLCGQGSSGKSTFGAELIKKLKSTSEFIRMDNIDETLPFSERLSIYIQNIQLAFNNKAENIIMDLAHDTVGFRNEVLSALNFDDRYDTINFFTISLRPSLDTILKREAQRKGYKELPKNLCFSIEKYYYAFQYPTEQEFEKYNFNTVTTLVIDNTNLFDSVNITVQNIEDKIS